LIRHQDGFLLVLWAIRILFLLLIYLFLARVIRALLRDLRAAAREPDVRPGRLVVLASRLGLSLDAATVDHGLRPEAASEARQVVERCRALGVACSVLTVDVRAARGRHVSWQDAARRNRGVHPEVKPVTNRLLKRMRFSARPALQGGGMATE